jgi:hypothetical protein
VFLLDKRQEARGLLAGREAGGECRKRPLFVSAAATARASFCKVVSLPNRWRRELAEKLTAFPGFKVDEVH